ncbi:glycosyl hydrolase family 28-related protein [Hyalangium gracile]|uniref:glycosyl hydrolase family 28-related protein n=1 Tax=Hyalangium gracile TaxID=394092 RepID=UPI001CCA2C05|nr:glycosyl hydrolase family 28-related protein [Hyalangium gracile]
MPLLAVALVLTPRMHLLAQTWNAADVMGPDGIIYPDWTWAGVPNGIPTQLTSCGSVTSHGAVANDNQDDAAALEAAAEACGQAGGGAVSIPAGTFHLDRPIFIKRSNVVLRGAGRALTKLLFRFAAPTQNVAFFFPPGVSGNTLAKNNWLEVHADPANLQRLTLKAGGVVVTEKKRANDTWGATFSVRATGSALAAQAGYGTNKQLVAEAEYPSGVITLPLTVTLNNVNDANAIPSPSQGYLGAINFLGPGRVGGHVPADPGCAAWTDDGDGGHRPHPGGERRGGDLRSRHDPLERRGGQQVHDEHELPPLPGAHHRRQRRHADAQPAPAHRLPHGGRQLRPGVHPADGQWRGVALAGADE